MNRSKTLDPRFKRIWANSGAVNFTKMEMEVRCGEDIHYCISKAIKQAGSVSRPALVSCSFNGVTFSVCHDSDAQLIRRDWQRALMDYISGKVGPYPKAKLSVEELASDEIIRTKEEARHAEQSAVYREEEERKKIEFFAELEMCPAMDRDEALWQEGIAAMNGDKYKLAIFTFAEYLARLIQKKMTEGHMLEGIAEECSRNVNNSGIGFSGAQAGAAMSVLARCWKYGEALRIWHNKQYLNDEEMKLADKVGATVNPAILYVS